MTLSGLLHDLSASVSYCLRGSPAEPNHESSLGPVSPLHESHDSQQAPSNRKPFRQSNAATEMILPCLLA
jgi:hypothetical protein